MNEIDNKKTMQKCNASKSWFFKNINTIDKSLVRVTKEKREKTQLNKIRDDRREVSTDTTDKQQIILEYYEWLYATRFNNLEEMSKFLEI